MHQSLSGIETEKLITILENGVGVDPVWKDINIQQKKVCKS